MRAGTSENHGEGESESEDSKNVGLQPVFEMENSELHFICAVGHHQQITAAKLAMLIFVIEMTIYFCGQKRHGKSFSATQTTRDVERLLRTTSGGETRLTISCVSFRRRDSLVGRPTVRERKYCGDRSNGRCYE